MRQQVVLIDNFDSFTYNLVEAFRHIDVCDLEVVTADQVDLAYIARFDGVVFSPGPGLPEEQPAMYDILWAFQHSKRILGVCLGHQAIAHFYGARLDNLPEVFHGRAAQLAAATPVDYLFEGLPGVFRAGLYHSWEVSDVDFPEVLRVTARSERGIIMALAHRRYDVRGVQFHPESFITEYGRDLLRNWAMHWKGGRGRA
jgi:anthranilate synthase/aminodeoxychorismate synthase-like glutamine amidotransferase